MKARNGLENAQLFSPNNTFESFFSPDNVSLLRDSSHAIRSELLSRQTPKSYWRSRLFFLALGGSNVVRDGERSGES